MSVVRQVLGKVAITPRGEYDDELNYVKLDVVTLDGCSYMAVQETPAGTPVTDTDYWMLLAKAGTGVVRIFIDETTGQYKIEYTDGRIEPFGDEFAVLMRDLLSQANTAKDAAATSASNAETSKTAAETAASNASGSASAAQTAKIAAETAATNATTAKNDAVAAKNAAETAKNTANTAASSAASAASAAVTAKNTAVLAKNAAETAQTGARTAENGAIAARNTAQTAATNAAGSASAAQTAKEAAATSASNATSSATAANASKEAAASAASAASESASSASSSANDASGYATAAETAASAAGSAASAAGELATNAAGSAMAANSAKTAAENAASAASAASGSASGYATNAASSATAAANSATAASSAKAAAETAKSNAETAASSASGSANAASGSASAANTAKEAAETAKTNAETAKEAAATSASNAAGSATNAADSATAAATSAEAAGQAATNAAREEIRNVTATASVDSNTGTPDVIVTKETISGHENLNFIFKNLKGNQGPKGDPGSSIIIKDHYNTLAELEAAHPVGNEGDMYSVGANNLIYLWDTTNSEWKLIGEISGGIPEAPIDTKSYLRKNGQWSEAYNKAEADATFAKSYLVPARRYIVRWDRTNGQMTRMGDAEGITTDTTNFTYNGSVNPNYNNPFDKIYPWSGIKLCNIDFNKYYAGVHKIEDAVKYWEGDANFSFNDEWGVWVYVPEFWGKTWSDETYTYFAVSDKKYDNSYKYYHSDIFARNKGVNVTRSIDGTNKTVILPIEGIPAINIAMSMIHTYAKNAHMSLDNIYNIDSITLLYLVEFAHMNSQNKLGNGVSSLYRQNEADLIVEATTNDNYVIVNPTVAGYCDVGAILDIGTSNGGSNVARCIVQGKEEYGDNFKITVDKNVTTTTDHFTSVHGMSMKNNVLIGSKSGYIGTNGRSDAYYRGQVLYSNMFIYILGIGRDAQQEDGNTYIWICPDEKDCDNYDTIDKTVFENTGIALALTSGYIKTVETPEGLNAILIGTEVGGSSSAPIGDYQYNGNLTSTNRVLVLGGDANYGSGAGLFYGSWYNGAGNSSWNYSARPHLKTL